MLLCGSFLTSMVSCTTAKEKWMVRNMKMKGKLNTRLKKLCVFIVALLVAVAGVSAGAYIYWSRTIQYNFKVIGISADLLVPTFDGYDQKLEASNLTDGKVALVILTENFHNIWLNVSYTSNATGLNITITHQYYKVYWLPSGSVGIGWYKRFEPLNNTVYNDTPNQPFIVDKTKMTYVPLQKGYPDDPAPKNYGYCLIVTFTFDTEYITTPGNYGANLKFDMGFS